MHAAPPVQPDTHPIDESIRVTVAGPADAADWDEAVGRLSGGSFYHRFAWRDVNERALGHEARFLVARVDGRVAGLLPLTLVSSRLFGRILCSAPFVNFGGICADDPSVVKALLERARAATVELRADCLEMRSWSELPWDVAPTLVKVSMVVPLQADPEQVWAAYSPKHRKNVRRAQKNGLEVVSGGAELLPEFYAVMERAWRDLGTPFYSRRYFEEILERLPDATRIFICRRSGKAIATALCGYSGGIVEGLWNGGLREARGLQANYVLYWEMIQHACRSGQSSFHLGRSTADSGSEEFKRKWNADKHQLYWYYWSPQGGRAPELNVRNPRFRLAIAAWRRLPLAVTRLIGPRLARAIP